MENLSTEAARAAQERAKRRRLEEERRSQEEMQHARQALHELIQACLGREADTGEAEISHSPQTARPRATTRIDHIRLAAFPEEELEVVAQQNFSDGKAVEDAPYKGYGLVALHQCRVCKSVDLMAHVGELADLGDFLGSDLVCPDCSAEIEDGAVQMRF